MINSEFQLISSILRNSWLIDKAWASDNLPIWANVLEGKAVNFGQAAVRKPEERVCVIAGGPAAATLVTPSYFSGFDKAPEGSFAKIDLIGPIMKYGYCSAGSYDLTQLVKEAKDNKNIRGLLIESDCPGGQVTGTPSLADAIYNFGKPTLTFINDGMMCSGGTWVGTSADEVYASHDLNTIGSIGVYQTIYDHSERLSAMGIKVIERYAKESTEKNKSFRDALAGDFDELDADLSSIAQAFIAKVQENRGDRLQGKPGAWAKGQTGSATWAQSIGLIDGICTFEQAVARLEEMAGGAKSKRATSSAYMYTQTPNSNMKFPKLAALAGVENATQEQLDAVNAELAEAGVTGVAVFNESVVSDAAGVTAERDQLQVKVTELENNVKTVNGKVDSLTAENTDLKAKVAAAPRAAAPVAGKEDVLLDQTEQQKNAATIAGLAHNQGIAGNPLFMKG